MGERQWTTTCPLNELRHQRTGVSAFTESVLPYLECNLPQLHNVASTDEGHIGVLLACSLAQAEERRPSLIYIRWRQGCGSAIDPLHPPHSHQAAHPAWTRCPTKHAPCYSHGPEHGRIRETMQPYLKADLSMIPRSERLAWARSLAPHQLPLLFVGTSAPRKPRLGIERCPQIAPVWEH